MKQTNLVKSSILKILIILIIGGIGVLTFSCSSVDLPPADYNDYLEEIAAKRSSSSLPSSSSVEDSFQSSSSSLSNLVFCQLAANCTETSEDYCRLLGGAEVSSCPEASSSSSAVINSYCVLPNGDCEKLNEYMCTNFKGTPVQSCSETSSSSATSPSSSSSSNCGSVCAAIPEFNCTVNPASPISGDEVTVSVNITGSGEGCTTKTYVEIEANNTFAMFQCYANYPITGPVVTAGELFGDCTNAGQTFTGKWSWPTSGTVTAVKGAVTCGTGASQNTETKACAITIQAPPAP
ncbi:MAG: hypothetical protein FWC26_04370 [Fibromonadales bacterium]|nr:hypothetical protein [Fibromonadales bacterium]